ncbi:MAG: 8-amino-7-oxononanoate synthase [Thermoguttaceae bacterium]|jgi:8-amino-7-oxononanoate synthase
MDPRLTWIEGALATLEGEGLRRRLTTRAGPQAARLLVGGRPLLNFGANDYLALAGDGRLAAAAAEALRLEGVGSGASPLLTGHASAHHRLETRLAEFEGTEAALVFPSGFAANTGTIAALVGPGDAVFSDAANHASLWDGCRLSRADVRVYPHADCRALERLLAAAGGAPRAARVPGAAGCRRKLVVTDGLFSMDGDLAPLGELADVCRRHAAMLLVDEAHATGVLGPCGRGAAELAGIEHRTSVRIGTLSKALGAAGGFAAGDRLLVEWLVNRARPYIYSTALPPAMAAAALAALDIVQAEPERRGELLQRAAALRRALAAQGWNLGRSAAQILPVIVGEAARAVAISARLEARGLLVPAIRPPTVPAGQACLRISLTCGHTEEMIEGLVEAMRAVSG